MRIEEQVMGDEEALAQLAQEVGQELLQEERGALLRVAKGLGGMEEARLLARSTGHADLFEGH